MGEEEESKGRIHQGAGLQEEGEWEEERRGGGEEGRRRGGEEERRGGGEEGRSGFKKRRRRGGGRGNGNREDGGKRKNISSGEWYSLVCENGREVFGDVNVQHCREVLVLIYLHHIEDAHLTNTQRSKIKGQKTKVRDKLFYY